jgi:hypothetical protein
MKYTNEIQINLGRERMIQLLDSAENMKHWQKGLINYKFLSGEPGQVGSKMELEYLMGKRKLIMVETITKRDFPNEFSGTYETNGVWNLVENHFYENPDGTTKWVSVCDFRFSGFMKIMSWFMPTSMFKKQSCQYLEDFKKFAEAHKE